MAPSEVKRFVAYLDGLSQRSSARAVRSPDSPTAAGTDFEETLELLKQFEDDERVRSVLLDPSDQTLRSTLASVQQELEDVEARSIVAYIEESAALNELHEQIHRCDADLGTAESRLSHFDAELSTVNEEMHTLEADSDRLAVMLRNRIAAAESLAAWLQDTTVMPALVRSIRDGDLANGPAYARSLAALRTKVQHMHAFADHEKLRAFPTLQALEATAVERVKVFLCERIAALKPGPGGAASNATIRRQGLLPYAPYTAFLRAHAPATLEAVRHRYCADSRSHLAASVKTYLAGLSAALLKRDKCLLVTAADVAEGGLPARLGHMFLPSAHDSGHLADFELGTRPEELLHPDFSRWPARALRASETGRGLRMFSPIVLQNLGKRKVPLEYAFKSVLHQLCDAAVGEFTFLEEFFGADAAATFDECWHPVLNSVHHELDTWLANCYDVIGVLLMTRIVSHSQLLMAHAQVPVFDSFLDRLGLMLWPHYSRLIREQINSITLEKDNSKARGLKPATPAVLLPTRRWASLFAALGQLNAEYNESQVHNNLDELSRAIQPLLYRIRLLFPRQLEGAVFHILNLQHIVAVLHAAYAAPLRTQLSSEVLPSTSGGLGDDAMATCNEIEAALALVKSQYKEELLSSHLQELMAYLSQAQAQLAAGKAPSELAAVLGSAAKPRKIVLEFKDRWKAMVSVIQKDVLKHFVASPACQAEMSRACLEELYKRFKDFVGILGMQGGEYAAAAKEGPSLQTVALELRELVR